MRKVEPRIIRAETTPERYIQPGAPSGRTADRAIGAICRAEARPTGWETGTGDLAAAVLGAPYPGRGGFRRARPVLPREPGQARVCQAARGLAVFVDPPRDRGGAMVGCVMSRTDIDRFGWAVVLGNGACEHAPTLLLRLLASDPGVNPIDDGVEVLASHFPRKVILVFWARQGSLLK